MKASYHSYTHSWDRPLEPSLDGKNTLVIAFGPSNAERITPAFNELVTAFPNSAIMGASSAGEILQDELLEESLVVVVLAFSRTRIKSVSRAVVSSQTSFEDGSAIAKALLQDDLKGMFVLTDGLAINGSTLTKGFNSVLHKDIIVTGGLAADDDRFENTWVIVDGKMQPNHIAAVGFYGENIHINHGSKGGWDKLGIARKVTRSTDNILYELDNQPSLEVYKRYLGDNAKGLPATGVMFPLELDEPCSNGETKVRTVFSVDEEQQSITFAGDIPEGSTVTLMKANYDRLIDGAHAAAEAINLHNYNNEPICCLVISCLGRRMVLKQRTEEELEATLEVLPKNTQQIGFYSYGEISPLQNGQCDLHNQTMTLTLLWESDAPTP